MTVDLVFGESKECETVLIFLNYLFIFMRISEYIQLYQVRTLCERNKIPCLQLSGTK